MSIQEQLQAALTRRMAERTRSQNRTNEFSGLLLTIVNFKLIFEGGSLPNGDQKLRGTYEIG